MWRIILLLSMCNYEVAKDSLVTICKKQNYVTIDYLDSRGISSIKQETFGDTLKLTILVSHSAKQHGENVALPANIRYIMYGNTIKELNRIDTCHRVYSGKEAVEFQKKQRN